MEAHRERERKRNEVNHLQPLGAELDAGNLRQGGGLLHGAAGGCSRGIEGCRAER